MVGNTFSHDNPVFYPVKRLGSTLATNFALKRNIELALKQAPTSILLKHQRWPYAAWLVLEGASFYCFLSERATILHACVYFCKKIHTSMCVCTCMHARTADLSGVWTERNQRETVTAGGENQTRPRCHGDLRLPTLVERLGFDARRGQWQASVHPPPAAKDGPGPHRPPIVLQTWEACFRPATGPSERLYSLLPYFHRTKLTELWVSRTRRLARTHTHTHKQAARRARAGPDVSTGGADAVGGPAKLVRIHPPESAEESPFRILFRVLSESFSLQHSCSRPAAGWPREAGDAVRRGGQCHGSGPGLPAPRPEPEAGGGGTAGG